MSTLNKETLLSPAIKQPPPAPRIRKGFGKNFQGSLLFLVSGKEQFATNDGENRPISSRSSFLRPSELFLARASTLSISKGFFPGRPSTPAKEGEMAVKSPDTSSDMDASPPSVSPKKKKSFSVRFKNLILGRRRSLIKKGQPIPGEHLDNIEIPATVLSAAVLPQPNASASRPNETSNHKSPIVTEASPQDMIQKAEENEKEIEDFTEERKEEEDSDEEDTSNSDFETIEVLTSRIGDKKSARTIVRVARAAEKWMNQECKGLSSAFRQKVAGEKVPQEELEYSTLFYGEKRPKIALDRYLGRLVRYLDNFSDGIPGIHSMGVLSLLGGVVLIERLASTTNFELDPMNTHRVFMIATLIAFKLLDDEPCSNEYFANVGGVELAELNMLETTFLTSLEFRANLPASEMIPVMIDFSGYSTTQKALETSGW